MKLTLSLSLSLSLSDTFRRKCSLTLPLLARLLYRQSPLSSLTVNQTSHLDCTTLSFSLFSFRQHNTGNANHLSCVGCVVLAVLCCVVLCCLVAAIEMCITAVAAVDVINLRCPDLSEPAGDLCLSYQLMASLSPALPLFTFYRHVQQNKIKYKTSDMYHRSQQQQPKRVITHTDTALHQ